MYRIFFENRSIEISSDATQQSNPNSVTYLPQSDSDILKIHAQFTTSIQISHLLIVTPDPERAYRLICSCFREVDAAGGVVENINGKYLLILRRSLWDLPKGYQEADETSQECAIREVSEECGLSCVNIEREICTTDHTYFNNGEYIIKHTRWYKMSCANCNNPIPQTSEEIERTEWVAKEDIETYISESYASIKEVFGRLGTEAND